MIDKTRLFFKVRGKINVYSKHLLANIELTAKIINNSVDDQSTFHMASKELSETLTYFSTSCLKTGTIVNEDKQEMMTTRKHWANLTSKLNSSPQYVADFKYFGKISTKDGRCDRETEARIQ